MTVLNHQNEYPNIQGQQKENLRNAMKSAYRKRDSLLKMLSDNSSYLEVEDIEDRLPENGEYDTLVYELIKWCQSQGKLRKLVIAASLKNPGNQKLRACVKKLLPDVFDDREGDLLPYELLKSLINTLNENFKDFSIILECCKLTLTDISIHRNKEIEYIEKTKNLVSAVKWLIVLGWFLKDYPNLNKIYEFLQHLKNTEAVNSEMCDSLSHHLNQIEQLPQFSMGKIREYPLEQKVISIRGALVIIVHLLGSSSTVEQNPSVRVNHFILIELLQKDESFQTELIPLQEYDLAVDNTQVSQQKISSYLKPIEKNLQKWVTDTEIKLAKKAEEVKCSHYDLTIEFFLPYEFLAESVEKCEVKYIPRNEKLIPVGQKYKVVVRSQDRLSDCYLQNQFYEKWENTCERGIQTGGTEQLDCLIGSDKDEVARGLEQNQRIALKLTCAYPNCQESRSPTDDLKDLFVAVLQAGTPITLWSRQCKVSGVNVGEKMDQLLSLTRLCKLDIDQLLTQVHKTRKYASKDKKEDLGHHLAIWCDEPERLRQVNHLLNENKLWGMSA